MHGKKAWQQPSVHIYAKTCSTVDLISTLSINAPALMKLRLISALSPVKMDFTPIKPNERINFSKLSTTISSTLYTPEKSTISMFNLSCDASSFYYCARRPFSNIYTKPCSNPAAQTDMPWPPFNILSSAGLPGTGSHFSNERLKTFDLCRN